MYSVISAIMYAVTYVNGANEVGVNGVNGNGVSGANGGWGWWWWIVVAVAIIIFIGAFARRPSQPTKARSEEILKERYARGEITKQEYDERLRVLHGTT